MAAKSRFAQFLKAYGDAVQAQHQKRSAAETEVASLNWIKGAAIDGAAQADGGEGAVPRILEAFNQHFGDDATLQHARLCFNAYRAYPTEASRIGRCWTACSVLVAPVKRLLKKEGDENPTPENVATYARKHFLEDEELVTVAALKAAAMEKLGEQTEPRKTRITISKARKTLREFLKGARPHEKEAFRSFLEETLKTLAPPAPAAAAKPADASGAASTGSSAPASTEQVAESST